MIFSSGSGIAVTQLCESMQTFELNNLDLDIWHRDSSESRSSL